MQVDMTLLERKIQRLTRQRELLQKKNDAIRRALGGISREGYRINGFDQATVLQNRIVRITPAVDPGVE